MDKEKIADIVCDCIQQHLHKQVSFTNENAREEVGDIMYGVEYLIVDALYAKGYNE